MTQPVWHQSFVLQLGGESIDPAADVVVDQPHSFDLRFAAEDDNSVGLGAHRVGELCGTFVGDVDSDLQECPSGQDVDLVAG